MLVLLTGCASWSPDLRQAPSSFDCTGPPEGPPVAVERWWNDYLADCEPGSAALILETSDTLRSNGRQATYRQETKHLRFGGRTGMVATFLPLPIPESCAARVRQRLANLPAEQLVPSGFDVQSITRSMLDPEAEASEETRILLDAARKLGYRGPPTP